MILFFGVNKTRMLEERV